MKYVGILAGALTAGMMVFSFAAFAAPVGGPAGNVTNNAIFGSGNGNGSFTGVQTPGGIEVGLRGKLRYDTSTTGPGGFGNPTGTYNYDGDRTYNFNQSDFNAPPNRSGWNFEWSINTNWNNSTINSIDSYDYLLSMDTDPGAGTAFLAFDPYFGPNSPFGFFDHSFGNNGTAQSAGVESTSILEFTNNKESFNLSQQSWNLGFFLPATALLQSAGIFTIAFDVFEKGTSNILASTNIDIVVSPVPIPGALPLFGSGLAILGFMGLKRRRDRRAAA